LPVHYRCFKSGVAAAAVQDASDIKRFGTAVSELLTPLRLATAGQAPTLSPEGAREAEATVFLQTLRVIKNE
jgi:hypothetical protein